MAAIAGFVIFGVYLVFIIATIAREPKPGAESPDQLAQSLVAALASSDASALNDLFAHGAIEDSDDFSDRLFAEVRSDAELRAALREDISGTVIVVTQEGRTGCLSWGVDDVDGRSVLSVVPPFSSC